jgi:hypothetical protein
MADHGWPRHGVGALAHPVRRRILESTIRSGPRITELSDDFDISLAAVSKATLG